MDTAAIKVLVFSMVLVCGGAVNAAEVDAGAARNYAKQQNCLRCHGVDKDKDGPAFNKIASKYKGTADAESKLIRHLTSGETAKFPDGHEEKHMMLEPADADDIKNLVGWILSL